MQGTLSKPSAVSANQSRAGALWLVQAFTGLLLVILLLLHMVAHHFVVEGGIRSFQDVVAYVSNPLIFTIEVVFLFVVTLHAMLGVRAILLDLGLGKRTGQVMNWVLGIAGMATVFYGIWLAVAIQNFG